MKRWGLAWRLLDSLFGLAIAIDGYLSAHKRRKRVVEAAERRDRAARPTVILRKK